MKVTCHLRLVLIPFARQMHSSPVSSGVFTFFKFIGLHRYLRVLIPKEIVT